MSTSQGTWTRLVAALAVLAVSSGAGVVPTLADTTPPVTAPAGANGFGFAVEPYASAGSSPRDYFEFQLQPGRTVSDRVSIINATDQPKDFLLYSSDAYNTERGGGFALRLRTEKSTDTGTWVKLSTDRYTVPARHAALVPVQFVIPIDATPGDHTAGIVAEEVVPPTTTNGPTGVQTVHRVAARVYLRVAGPLRPALQIREFAVTHENPVVPYAGRSATTITFNVANSGNLRLQPDRVTVTVSGLFGRTIRRFTLARPSSTGPAALNPLPDTILPGSSIHFTKSFKGRFQPFEPLTARVTVASQDPILGKHAAVSRTVRFWVFSLLFLVAVLALVGGLVGRHYWRKYRTPAEAAVEPAVPAAPAAPAGPAVVPAPAARPATPVMTRSNRPLKAGRT